MAWNLPRTANEPAIRTAKVIAEVQLRGLNKVFLWIYAPVCAFLGMHSVYEKNSMELFHFCVLFSCNNLLHAFVPMTESVCLCKVTKKQTESAIQASHRSYIAGVSIQMQHHCSVNVSLYFIWSDFLRNLFCTSSLTASLPTNSEVVCVFNQIKTEVTVKPLTCTEVVRFCLV